MDIICKKDLCTACGACKNICAKDAISMLEHGALGYVYPVIDQDKCVDCGLCQKVCPVNHIPQYNEPLLSVAAICKNDEDTKASASGGAAYSLGRYIIEEEHGVVYGCELLDYVTIMHTRYSTLIDLGRMRGSKYVQSDTGLIYRSVKEDLLGGLKVLFTGTPCQIAGLKGFLRKDYDNLYCVDLVCHGVPSQKLLRDDTKSMFTKCGKDIPDGLKTKFRSIISCKDACLEILFGNFVWKPGTDICDNIIPFKEQIFPNNDYITAFMYGLTFRENCYTCPYAQKQRVSDITVADYWGLGKDTTIPDGLGVSLLLPSTEKGVWLFEKAKKYMKWELRNVDEAVRGNGQLMKPSSRPVERDTFMQEYEKQGGLAYIAPLKKYRRQVSFNIRKAKTFRKYSDSKYMLLLARIYYKILSKIV